MEKLILILSLVFCILGGTTAQQKKQRQTPEDRARIQTEILENNLELTADQKKQVYDVFLKYAQPVAMWERVTNKEELQALFDKRMSDKDAEVRALLTQEQQQAYDQLRKLTQERKQKAQENVDEQKTENVEKSIEKDKTE